MNSGSTDSSKAPGSAAVSIGRFCLKADPVTGDLYPTSETTDIRFRDNASGHLIPSDDTALPAARTAIVAGARGRIY
jgi:hypothetical protein